MANKFISLEEKAIDISVGGEIFTISRLTLKAQDMANRYKVRAAQLYGMTQEFIGEIQSLTELEEIREKTDEYQGKAEAGETEIYELKMELLEKILTDNGLEFDLDFWDGLDSSIPDAFINAVLTKNQDDVKKKEVITAQ
jgi:hypothetical protein